MKTTHRAFTLIELLTVIAIIGILAAMLMAVLAKVKQQALKNQAKTEIQAILTAIEAYDSAYGRFPVSHAAQTQAAANAQAGANPDFTYGGTFPPAVGGNVVQTAGLFLTNSEVIAILMDFTNYPGTATATINTNHQSNPKQIKYLNATLSSWDASQSGPPTPGVGNDLVYRDPWGNPYVISLDLNYDDQCSDALYSQEMVSKQNGQTGFNGLFNPIANPATQPQRDNYLFHGKIMVWSAGPDGKFSPGKAANTEFNKDNILSWQ
jgi:prepilin-type N-terminal cleavage/methylation domain-containing protein